MSLALGMSEDFSTRLSGKASVLTLGKSLITNNTYIPGLV